MASNCFYTFILILFIHFSKAIGILNLKKIKRTKALKVYINNILLENLLKYHFDIIPADVALCPWETAPLLATPSKFRSVWDGGL